MFVRQVAGQLGLPLLERTPPDTRDHYRSLVLERGFPGPAQHYKMFQRLKERSLRQIRNELVANPHKQRVVFLAGRRRDESGRRAHVPELERDGSIVWRSPLVHRTATDLRTYRTLNDVPRNEVADLLHMSGECLCGSFAAPGERELLAFMFPEDFAAIAALEAEIADRDDIPAHRKRWGWGAAAGAKRSERATRAHRSGPLCSSCPLW